MNEKRIALGLAAWFLGIIVPVYHHVTLYAAMANRPSNNVIIDIQLVFNYLPWIDWLYLVLMLLVGAILIVSGMIRRP
jgi:hypothetical protein